MKWIEASEIVGGLALKERLDPNAVNLDTVFPPYNDVIAMLRDGKDVTTIIEKVSFAAVDACMQAEERVNGTLDPMKWLKLLEETASSAKAADKLEPLVRQMRDGQKIDVGSAMAIISMADQGYTELTPMSKIEPQKNPWILTGYEPIDKHIGGLPEAGLIVVGASPGVGKTTLMLKIAKSMVKKHKKKKVAIFTLEMTMTQITSRMLEIDDTLTDSEKDRILLGETAYNVKEIYAIASRTAASDNLSLICIDFADQMVEGEQTESIMGQIYRVLSMLAKRTGVPVLLLSQLNRETYKGGEPRINHLRYSGMAEAMSALILLIYNPSNILISFEKDKSVLPTTPGIAYLLVGKSRFGFKEGAPGGIKVEWDGKLGWGDKSLGYTPLAG